MKQMINQRPFSDIVFKVDNEKIFAHRAIIQIRCESLSKLFGEPGNSPEISMKNTTTKPFLAFLEWIYSADIDAFNLGTQVDLGVVLATLKLANEYQVKQLANFCESTIMNNLTVNNMDQVFEVLKRQGKQTDLTKFCSHFIVSNFNHFVKTKTFANLSLNEILEFVRQLTVAKKESNENKKDGPRLEAKNLKLCQQILAMLGKREEAWPFSQPVDPIALGIPDYFDIIKHPMDLGTIKKRLGTGVYKSQLEFAADVRLVFTNALTYNQPGSSISIMSEALAKLFEDKFGNTVFERVDQTAPPIIPKEEKKEKPEKVEKKTAPPKIAKETKEKTHTSRKRKQNNVQSSNNGITNQNQNQSSNQNASQNNAPNKEVVDRHPQVTSPNLPSPSASSPNTVSLSNKNGVASDSPPKMMSLAEKQKLGERMNSLTTDQLHEVVRIIDPKLTSQEDVEIDMNDIEPATLRKMEAYVNSCLRDREVQTNGIPGKSKETTLEEEDDPINIDDTEDFPDELSKRRRTYDD